MVDLAVLLAPIPYSSSTPSQSPDAVINQWQSIVKTNADIASADTDTDTATAIQSSVGPKPTQTNSQSVGVQLPLQDESIRYDIIRDGLYAICNNTLTEICYEVICVTFGCLSRKNYSPQSAGNIFGHYPQPSSEQNNKHWDQFKGPLMKFDFGTSELNTEKYGQATPPIYDLSKLSVNVALFYGSDDPTAQSLINGGPNLLPAHRVVFQRNVTGYGHADFVWGVDAATNVYLDVLNQLRK